MLSINTNLSSLIAQGSMKQSTNKLNQAIERMTTGFKINHAKDNAANYSISTNMTTKIGAYNVAEDNAAMGLDLISTAEGTLSQIEDKLQRLRALAEQAANGTYGEQSLNAINAEANALVDEIERIYNNTEYNGINLMKGRVVGTEESKFIKDIDRRDTSKMTTLASVDENEKLEYGTYSISTPEELAKLATMTNNGLIGTDTEFVLANDIDLSGYSNWTPIGTVTNRFSGIFDGNGYVISNLRINSTESYQALFGYVGVKSVLSNIGIENASVASTAWCAGVLVGKIDGGYSIGSVSVKNCYTEGSISGKGGVGGFAGVLGGVVVDSCYSACSVYSSDYDSGGFAANISDIRIYDCFSEGVVSSAAWKNSGSFIGYINGSPTNAIVTIEIYNSYSTDTGVKNFIGGVATGVSYIKENCYVKGDGSGVIEYTYDKSANINSLNSKVNLQVGIQSNLNSQIDVDTGYLLNGISVLRKIGSGTGDYLSMLDKMLAQVSEKQTLFGATSNRLESVLEEIPIQRDNLV